MTAKEMFEKCGFVLKENSKLHIWYVYKGYIDIIFYKQRKCYVDDADKIDMQLHIAINKQCQELGWIE